MLSGENYSIDISQSLEKLCRPSGPCAADLQGLLAKQIWTPEDRQNLLQCLSSLLLNPSCTGDVAASFPGLLLELVHRAKDSVTDSNSKLDWLQHQRLSIALGKIVHISSDARSFAVEYLSDNPPFYGDISEHSSPEPVVKKAKKSKQQQKRKPSGREIAQSVYRLVLCLGNELSHVWNWGEFVKYLQDEDLDTRWFALHSLGLILGMCPAQLEQLKDKHFSNKQQRDLLVKYDDTLEQAHSLVRPLGNPGQNQQLSTTHQSHTIRAVLGGDLRKDVVSVCGVVLPCNSQQNTDEVEDNEDPLILVPSTRRNLRSLALAVAAGSAVLLEGAVGSGKTALIEHLARKTGRSAAPQLMKIQLGDQTDSKALLGTYRCTDVPGEFVWQAGSLTRAVLEGHWILLEDLDYAPMDVVSLLVSLLESNTLSCPGHGDQIPAAPGFRLFATQRLLSTKSGWFKSQHTTDILDKLWVKITVEPLSRDELQQVICSNYPQLSSVVDRLLDIYFLLSAGKHELSGDAAMETDQDQDVGRFLSHDGRMISTRDLMKWCSRIAHDFDVSKSATSSMVFQEALDCFCSSLSKSQTRLLLAGAMGSKLNLSKEQAEYYCIKYKPNIEISRSKFNVGRVCLPRKQDEVVSLRRKEMSSFAFTRPSVALLETVAVCINNNEPVLLVGETGTGKTSTVQYLAQQTGHSLKVINMSQQSDSTDLMGGFKPVDLRLVVAPLREEFELQFGQTFSRKQNIKFLGHLQECFSSRRWPDLFGLMDHSQKSALKKCKSGSEEAKKWKNMGKKLHQLRLQVKQSENALAFSFIEGTLVKALKTGQWVLLDEINLATAETLECLSGLLESSAGSVVLLERGDTEPIVRHPGFRLFACMNPATDVGKKDLPPGVRNRFTEFFVDELESSADLKVLVAEYLKGLSLSAAQVEGIVKFYQVARTEAAKRLVDGTGHKPHYSLRTLCRALRQAAINMYGSVPRSLYESFCLAFLTQVNRGSHPVVEHLVRQHVVGTKVPKSVLTQPLPEPPGGGKFLQFEGYWLKAGTREPERPEGYVLTPSVRANLRDLVRIVSAGRYPVLLQGETSVGKTSLINWLAQASGNVCVRINNHEHTDLQEYVGCYAASETGKLVFKEGVLVEAMKKGYWIILDELNLAPTDVLEALNRLLDDNRELFIPETQEVIKAHPKFMLFATQNPPGQYGGRKVLSRAFRNRFLELHFDEIPSKELETILHQRCSLPLSYCRRLVAVMLELQTRRRSSGVFAGKQGYITLRDLFRWAERYRQASVDTKDTKYFDWDQLLADNGYMLLAGRVRLPDEAEVIREVIQKHIKRKVCLDRLFSLSKETSPTTAPLLETITGATPEAFKHVVWTYGMRRMAVLMGQALKFGEPVLLVGDTGCGKTTLCQVFANLGQQQLHTVNCHMHTESSDFLGGLHPVRHRQEEDSGSSKLFEWCDGPLVLAMQHGSMFLIDEISLADDSVLERLNSVLEPERKLLLAEKAGGDGLQNEVEELVAAVDFRLVGTMNPGGDYGKKELSPALRNRFTEIWCPQTTHREDMVNIIEHNVKPGIHLCNQQDGSSGLGCAIMDFLHWFGNNELGRRSTISIRDVLSWVHFINATSRTVDGPVSDDAMELDQTSSDQLEPALAYIHGACMVFLDALGSGHLTTGTTNQLLSTREMSLTFLADQIERMTGQSCDLTGLRVGQHSKDTPTVVTKDESFGIEPFYIPRGPLVNESHEKYALSAPTTCTNGQRILRALQLTRPILLEGSPGVGKTSLVAAIARAAGHELVRINLSEQTDVSDLFGADLPVEGGEGGQFAWRDGPLLRALKAGHWIVLDELNLASQSVLEGLNACLDHRAEIFVPELAMTFQVQAGKTRLFACQNPLNQGGGRKGLPRSFLNRFTQVYVEPLSKTDLQFITETMYPQLPKDLLSSMIDFNEKVFNETMVEGHWGRKGSPWEFNLRDLFRWCDLLLANQAQGGYTAGDYVSLVYADRMRTAADKQQVLTTFAEVFGETEEIYQHTGQWNVTTDCIQVGHSFLPRVQGTQLTGPSAKSSGSLQLLHQVLPPIESLMTCIEMNWMAILIGGSGSGKTSLVRLLAQLSGHPLHILPMNSSTDTTELLGGFEQGDLNRHLEDLSIKVQRHLQEVTSQALLANQKEGLVLCQKVLSTWAKYNQFLHEESKASISSQDEAAGMQRKLKKLKQVISLLQSLSDFLGGETNPELCEVKEKLHKLQKQLQDDMSTNHGGMFEWIDSILVKSLREGHWLLIDNVNFCSPSVLDRLNALLEPNGVLSITERGVIDGCIPSIKPHPDFRLILAMDPRHGEISRAMRNRGVEIYILGENEGSSYNTADLKRMLHSVGLVGKLSSEFLLDFHERLREVGHAATPFALADLLRAGLLSRQQMDRGVDLKTALLSSCLEVYARGQLVPAVKQQLTEMITQRFCQWDPAVWESDTGQSGVVEAGLWPDSAPSCGDWCRDVTKATTRHQSIPILHLINLWMVKTDAKSPIPLTLMKLMELDRATSPKPEALTEISSWLIPMLKITVENTGATNWDTMLDWLKHALDQRLGNAKKAMVPDHLPRKEAAVLRGLRQLVEEWTRTVFEHPLMSALKESLQQLGSQCREMQHLLQQPFDLRWNRELLKWLQARLAQEGHWNPELGARLQKMHCLCNQLYLVGQLSLLQFLHTSGLDADVKPSKKHSLLQCSYMFHQGKQTADSLPHPVTLHIYPLVSLLHTQLQEIFSTYCQISDDDLQDLFECLQWYDRLVEVCLEPLAPVKQRGEQLARLSLHWGFFEDRVLSQISRNNSFSAELQSVITQLAKILGTENAAWKLHQQLWVSLGHPPAFSLPATATYVLRLKQLYDLVDLRHHGSSLVKSSANQMAKIRFALDHGKEFRTVVLNTLLQISEQGDESLDDTIEAAIASLEDLLKEQGFSLSAAAGTELLPVLSQLPDNTLQASHATTVALWPLHEHLGLRSLLTHISGAVWWAPEELETAELARVVDWLIEHTQIDVFQLRSWRQVLFQDEKELVLKKSHCLILKDYLSSLWTSLATRSCDTWLLWQPSTPSSPDGREEERPVAANVGSGAPFLFCAGMSYSAFHLLGHGASTKEKPKKRVTSSHDALLPGNISLGTCSEKLEQLSLVSCHLWTHAGMWSSEDWDPCKGSCRMLLAACQKLASAACSASQEVIPEETRTCLALFTDPAKLLDNLDNTFEEVHKVLTNSVFNILLPNSDTVASRCLESMQKCVKVVLGEPIRKQTTLEKMGSLGEAWAYMGLLQTFLLAPQGPVDPAEEVSVLLEYTRQELSEVKQELQARSWERELRTGQGLPVSQQQQQQQQRLEHPLLQHLVRRQEALTQHFQHLSGQVAFRPRPQQFLQLLQEIRQFLQTHGSADRISALISDLKSCLSSPDGPGSRKRVEGSSGSSRKLVQQQRAWHGAVWEFVQRMEKEYPLYQDLVVPFVAGIVQMQFGLGLLAHAVEGQQKLRDLLPTQTSSQQLSSLKEMMGSLGRFPTLCEQKPSSLSVAQCLLADDVISALGRLLQSEADGSGVEQKHLALILRAALLCIRNHAATRGDLDPATLTSLSHVLDLYVTSWRRSEDERRLKEEEEASLYKYKAQIHGDELTEEEEEERAIQETFPSFEADFEDITVGFTLDDKPKRTASTKGSETISSMDDSTTLDVTVTQSQMQEICHLYCQLFTELTASCAWHQGEPHKLEKTIDYVEPALVCYQVAAHVGTKFPDLLPYVLDGELVGSHLLMCRTLQNSVTVDAAQSTQRPYDVYHDPNVAEVSQCCPLLETFLQRVQELLAEWPDHPTLKQLITITQRILSFSVVSPLMKFVAGLEVLLQKAQEWERNAARHVSLQTNLSAISQMMIQWRKLELRCWQSCLDTVAWKVQQKASKWWFHIYQLVQSYLQPDDTDTQGEDTDATPPTTPKDLLQALQQFMEGSSLGEFDLRLRLLLAFHCQLTIEQSSSERDTLMKLLWNVHQFYGQFQKQIQSQITTLRQPIEKELKGFVKIARWNDINFYALKQAVEKIHRTLHKQMKRFEGILSQPVKPVLSERSSDAVTPRESERSLSKSFLVKLVEVAAEDDKFERDSLLGRMPALSRKMRKHCNWLFSSLPYVGLVNTVEDFTGDIIESVQELQAMDVSKITDKAKQKSEAKHIQLRKRKALSDLFKYLQTLGLSYRRGSLALKETGSGHIHQMMTPPLDLQVMLTQLQQTDSGNDCDPETLQCWQGCQKYQLRCVARRAVFHSVLQSPSKELGLGNLERCKGFSEHLTALVQGHWERLAQFAETYNKFRHLLASLQRVEKSNTALPPQDKAKHHLERVRELCSQALEVLRQTEVMLECCPKDSPGGITVPSPLAADQLAKLATVTQEDEAWKDAMSVIQSTISKVQDVKVQVDREAATGLLATREQELLLKEAYSSLAASTDPLAVLIDNFAHPTTGQSSSLSQSLVFLHDSIQREHEDYMNSQVQPDPVCVEDSSAFLGQVNDVIASILLAVQNLVKGHRSGQKENDPDGDSDTGNEEEIESSWEIVEGHLTKCLLEDLQKDSEALSLGKVCAGLERLITLLSTSDQSQLVAPAIKRSLPLLDGYSRLAQYHLTESVATHRASAKLLSVLLGVFTELAQKGFCLPAEYSDEAGEEGATQFEDIEGGGLGEGEGSKDVSDQIETEDQLEEAHRAGEEKEETEQTDQPDIAPEDNAIEMSGDMEGKLHDLEPEEGEEDSEKENEMDENDLDKQMGDLEGKDADKLDEQIWGSDEDEEKEEAEESKEESGPGAGAESQPELVAKDDNQEQSDKKGDEKQQQQDQNEDGEKEEENKTQDLDHLDEREYDDNEVDPHYGDNKPQEEAEAMDLPEDLTLDEKEGEEDGGDKDKEQPDQMDTENDLDIDKLADSKDDEGEGQEEEDQGQKDEAQEDEETKDDTCSENKEKPEEDKTEDPEKKETEEAMETDEQDGEAPTQEQGFQPQADTEQELPDPEQDKPETDKPVPQAADHSGQTRPDAEDVQQAAEAKDAASASHEDEEEKEESEGRGMAESEQQRGNQGDSSNVVTQGKEQQKQASQRKPGQSREERSLGSTDEKVQRRLKTVDSKQQHSQPQSETQETDDSALYEHIQDSQSHHDKQTLDSATSEQQQQQQQQTVPELDQDTEAEKMEDDDGDMQPDDTAQLQEHIELDKLAAAKMKTASEKPGKEDEEEEGGDASKKVEVSGERTATLGVARGDQSTIHTAMEHYAFTPGELDVEKLRAELEQELSLWSHPTETVLQKEKADVEEAWHMYEALTASLSQELCEQLRLLLEPSQASRLRGDYRTGKRLNMRKVIPYIASQFRKDKIWLRRTKPSKRNYQVMVAMDDSSSMADNHSKQLGFESLAVIANALTLLEVGELGIASFGESVKLLHSFHEQFSSQSGATILQQFTFEQQKTRIAQLLKQMTDQMMTARARQHGAVLNPETSQLLLIISDGRGLFLEGMEAVRAAVRQAHEARVFIVFVIIDSPDNKDSILDIRVPVFKGPGQVPEIKSYMDNFPFPFYIILRDINSLPHTLSDALRQWFELVTAIDM